MGKRNHTFKGLRFTPCATLNDALREFGMDFEVSKRSLFYPDENGDLVVKKGRIQTGFISPLDEQVIRTDNENPMGVVGLVYKGVPFREAFSPAEALILGGARIVGGGCPNRGERGYLVLEADGVVTLGARDKIINRFLLLSSHDGTGKIELRMTPYWERVGTAMTLDAASPLSFKHTPLVSGRVARAHKVWRRVNETWNEYSNGVQRMISIPLTDRQSREFIESVLPHDDKKGPSKRLENIRDDIYQIYQNTGIGTRLPKCRNTLFGVVQAFTEWADIKRTVRESSKRDEISARLDARLVSDSAKKKQKAYAMALWLSKQKSMSGALSGRRGK
jgi:phage/plasmid-like protein (TIGR03299 family)